MKFFSNTYTAKMFASHLMYLVILSTICTMISGQGRLGRDKCVFVDHVEKKTLMNSIPCSNSTVCQRHFKITYINIIPYVYLWNDTYWGIEEVLLKCCGSCVKFTTSALKNITELTVEVLEKSDIVFPILSLASTRKLYDFHFLPYVHVPTVFYITKNQAGLARGLLNCYPIVVLCLLLSVVSGFIAWLFERWGNKEEFPRPFLIGCFEGFWWAFISMTTVGYGDKTPRTIGARLFSIVWIMIGIIGFGILTGQLTGEIVKANSPPAPALKGEAVGALKFRDHDSLDVLERGGRVVRNKDPEDFYSDLLLFIEKLRSDEIEGFVLDKWTYAYIMLYGEKFMTQRQHEFFLNYTTHTEKASVGEAHSYGILVRDKSTFQYFEEYVRDSQDRYQIIREEWYLNFMASKGKSKHQKDGSHNDLLLAPSSPLFRKLLVATIVFIGLTLMFGLVCEYQKKMQKYGGKLCEKKKTLLKIQEAV